MMTMLMMNVMIAVRGIVLAPPVRMIVLMVIGMAMLVVAVVAMRRLS